MITTPVKTIQINFFEKILRRCGKFAAVGGGVFPFVQYETPILATVVLAEAIGAGPAPITAQGSSYRSQPDPPQTVGTVVDQSGIAGLKIGAMEVSGLEPLTSCLQSRRSTN